MIIDANSFPLLSMVRPLVAKGLLAVDADAYHLFPIICFLMDLCSELAKLNHAREWVHRQLPVTTNDFKAYVPYCFFVCRFLLSFSFLRIDFKQSGDSVCGQGEQLSPVGCVCKWACINIIITTIMSIISSCSEPIYRRRCYNTLLLWYITTLLAQKWMSWESKRTLCESCFCRFEFTVMVCRTINNTAWTIMAFLCLATITMIDSVSRWWLHNTKRVRFTRICENALKIEAAPGFTLCRHSMKWHSQQQPKLLPYSFILFCVHAMVSTIRQTVVQAENVFRSRQWQSINWYSQDSRTQRLCSLGATLVHYKPAN